MPFLPKRFLGELGKLFYWRWLRYFLAWVPAPLMLKITALFSRIQFAISHGKRRIKLIELSRCGLVEEDRAERVVRKAFEVQNNSQVKLTYLTRMDEGNIERYVKVRGLSNLDESLAGGRGIILLNPHFGPFMLVMPALGYRGYKVHQLALQGETDMSGRRGLARLVYRAKYRAIDEKMPINFINAASNMALREANRALGRNEIVLFASTGRAGHGFHEVDFLGRRATFNLTPFRIALKKGAPILPIFLMDSHPFAELIIDKQIDCSPDDSPEALLLKYTAVLEEYVRKYPEHFAYYLYDMHVIAYLCDNPFFVDYEEYIEGKDRINGARKNVE